MGFFTRSSSEIQRSIESVQKSIEQQRKALDFQKQQLETDRYNHNKKMDAYRGKHSPGKKPDKNAIEQEMVWWEKQQRSHKIQFDHIRYNINDYQRQLKSLKEDLAEAKEREKLEKQREKEEEKSRAAAQKEKEREEKIREKERAAEEKERERQRIAREKAEEAERLRREAEEARIAAIPVTEKEIDDNFLRVSRYAIRSGAIGSSMLVSEFKFRPKLAAAMINKLEKEGVIYQETNNDKYDCLVSNADSLSDILKESPEEKASRISASLETLRQKKELQARERARIAAEQRARAEAERKAREAERQARETEKRAQEEERARLEAEKRKRAKAKRKWIIMTCIGGYIVLLVVLFAHSYFSERSSIKHALADKEYAKAGELMIQNSSTVNESMAIDFFSHAVNYDDAIKLIPAVAEALSSSKYEKTYRLAVSSLCEKGLYQEAIDCLNIPFNPVAEEELAVDYRNVLEEVLKVKNRKMRKAVLDSAAEVCPDNMSTVVEPLFEDYLGQKRYKDCAKLLLDYKAPDLLERLVDQMVQDGKKSEAKRILGGNEAAIQDIKSIDFYQSLLEKLN